MSPVSRTVVYAALAAASVSPAARAQYDVEPDSAFWVRALLDVRIARGGEAVSWTDHGRGKTRYGASASDGQRETRFVLSQLAVQAGAALPAGVRAQAQVNVQPDIADGYEPWLVEAFLRKEWEMQDDVLGLQAGLMGSPFSLEHMGPAWSPEHAISASALNTWLWEEITVAGVEGEWAHNLRAGPRIGVVLGAGFGPDQLARLLALRGWVIGDHLSGLNADLPLPNGTRTEIFDERDDRPALYTLVTLGDASERAALKLGYFDNLGDLAVQGVWRTRVATAGLALHPLPSVELLVQYLRGEAEVRSPSNDSSLRAFYALLSYARREHQVSARYDEFRTRDLDGGNSTVEMGDALTLAYAYESALRHLLAADYTQLESLRPAKADPRALQDGWQIRYPSRS
jgi:hypothetical protein